MSDAAATLIRPRGPLSAALALGTVAVFGAATVFVLTTAQPLAAVAVPLAAGMLYGLYKLPLKVSVLTLLGLVLISEGLQYPLGPLDNWPVPLLHPLAKVLFQNLNSVTGIPVLRAPLIDVATVVLFVVSIARRHEDGWVAPSGTVRAMHMVLWTSAGTAIALVLLGVAQGGGFDDSLWQMRHTLLFPVRAVLLMRALEGTVAELKLIGALLVGAALVKTAIGLWVLYVVAPATGIESQFTTAHSDTLLFVPVLVMLFAYALESPPGPGWLKPALFGPLVLWGLIGNDRRVSYVSLFIAGLVVLLMCRPTPLKRAAGRLVVALSPLLPVYVTAGWTSDGKGLFFPVGVLKSLIVGEHRFAEQVDYRDLENLDVLYTWSQHRLVPLGFGHKFDILFPLPDISRWFETWQFHPHNSLLWFATVGGPIGLTLMMLPLVATLYLAARTYRASLSFHERVAMLTAVAVVIAAFNQFWGDQGTLAWIVNWMAALAAALTSRLALRTGAWPAMLRVMR